MSWRHLLLLVLLVRSAPDTGLSRTLDHSPDLQESAAPGEWPCFRGDKSLDGHSRLTGRISEPSVVWSVDVNPTETRYILMPTSDVPTAPLESKRPNMELGEPRWGLAPPAALAGGQMIAVNSTASTIYADILPEYPGLEKLEFDSGFSTATVNGQWQAAGGRCMAWKENHWIKVWEADPINLLFSPLPITGDFNNDGHQKVAILPWNDLLILDARTGRVTDRCPFTEGRSYGAFYVEDVDGDHLQEFIVLSDFAKHINVLGYRNGKLGQLWHRDVEMTLDHPGRVLRAHPHPLADVNGDGQKELMVSIFNETGDQRWHLLAFNAITGAVMADMPDEFMQGLADVDADGIAELLTCRTRGASIPEFGTIEICSLKKGKPVLFWKQDDAGWETWEPPLQPNVNSEATKGKEDVLMRQVDGTSWAVFRKRSGDRVTLTNACWPSGVFHPCASVTGQKLCGLGMDKEGNLLFRALYSDHSDYAFPEPRAERGRLIKGGSRSFIIPRSNVPIVMREAGTTNPIILTQDSAAGIVLLQTDSASSAPRVVRRIAGRAQSSNWPNTLGPVVADLKADGHRELLVSTSSPEGHARIAAIDLHGDEFWHHDFPDVPGTPPVWNSGGVILWATGHFTDRAVQDVLVNVRRSIMHTDETFLLAGRDGHELWHRSGQIRGRGTGGQPFAIADFDGDGLDDAASLYPDLVYVLKGNTGKDLVDIAASWTQVPVKPVYWGLPIAVNCSLSTATSSAELSTSAAQALIPSFASRHGIFFASGRANMSMTGLVNADGHLAWWDALENGGEGYPAFGDFHGNGQLQAVCWGYSDGMRCYDVATGKIQWRINSPVSGNLAGSASADLNGDGRDEALFSGGARLFCLGYDTGTNRGKLLWNIGFPANLGPPIIADVDGGGRASILVEDTNGTLYCIR